MHGGFIATSLLKLRPALSSRILGSGLDDFAFVAHLVLFLQDPLFASLGGRRGRRERSVSVPASGIDWSSSLGGVPATVVFDDDVAVEAGDRTGDVCAADVQDEVELGVFGAAVVFEEAGAEAGLGGCLSDHVALLVVFGVELADCFAAAAEGGVERVEEAAEPALGADIGGVGVAEPLDCADGDGGVEAAGSETESLADVGQEEVSVDAFTLEGDAEHAG